jgi:hypothetical protein
VSADRAGALKAIDDAFRDGVEHLYEIFVQGLETGTPSQAELIQHFRAGLAHRCNAHGKTTAAVIDYFQGEKRHD